MDIKQYLPSKSFQKKAGITAMIGIFIITAINLNLSNKIDKNEPELAKFTLDKTDTDGDGLRDWEEEIWGTDIYNPDTDGDGMDDGEEVNSDRDPNKNSNDTLTDGRIAAVYASYKQQSLKNINITKQIAERILPHSLVLADELERTRTISDTSKTDLLIKPIIEEFKLETPQLVTDDIVTIPTTTDSLLEYFNTILEVSNIAMANDGGSEIALLIDESKVDIAKLQNNYRLVVSTFVEAQVPNNLADKHVEVLNNFIKMQHSFDLLLSSDNDDSAKTIYALDQLQKIQKDNRQAIGELATLWRSEIDKR